ncbi:hypothetical protein [Mycolicibacterium porcinum]|uniref:ESX secretion-associated protein EspG n=1 Tax=Mycolicibacterium porcinum TaxID=39693 RepID=A0ABV3VJT0_9MYCO
MTATTINNSPVRVDLDLEQVAHRIVSAHPDLARVYGTFNACFRCDPKTLTGFMDLGPALYDHAPASVTALAPHLALPDHDATIRFRERLEEQRIPTWETHTIRAAQEQLRHVTRTVHEHNHVHGHFPLTPAPLPVVSPVPNPSVSFPTYYWTDTARFAGVTDPDALDEVKRENRSVLNGFLRPQTVSDVFRAVPRTVQFDADLLLVDAATGKPRVWVERAHRTHSTATAMCTRALGQALDLPMLHVQWVTIDGRHTVYWTSFVDGVQVPGGTVHGEDDLSQTTFDVIDAWVRNGPR